jgi:four helix bundle protein
MRECVSTQEAKAAVLQGRLTSFAARVIAVAAELPQNMHAKHVSGQILRSATSVASNYAEARSAESRPDFIHKLRIVLKELNETEVWLDLVVKSRWLPAEKVREVAAENRELCCIIAKSIKTAGGFER